MQEQEYLDFLKTLPDHKSPEFMEALRANNVVVWHFDGWLIIENIKYNNAEMEWHTAFWEDLSKPVDFSIIEKIYADYEWRKKSPEKQTIKRFHIHLYRPRVVKQVETLQKVEEVKKDPYFWGE